MAHFLASVKGSRGEASRLGTKQSGLDVVAASWSGSVRVRLWFDESSGVDHCSVFLSPWHGSGVSVSLYRGPVGEFVSAGVCSDLRAKLRSVPSVDQV